MASKQASEVGERDFEEVGHVFRDPLHLSVQDRVENGELRWRTFGLIGGVLILVAHTATEEDAKDGVFELIRIVSARRATPSERRRYENEKG